MRSWFRTRPQLETKAPSEDAGPACAVYPIGGIFGGIAPLTVALRIPAVASAVQIISEAVATLDVGIAELKDGREEKVTDHPILGLLKGSVNDWTTGFEFTRQLVIDALTDDRGGMAWVNRVNGEVREVIRYLPGIIICDPDTATGERRYWMNAVRQPLDSIIHVLPPLGRAPLSLAWDAIKTAAALDNHAQKLFSNGARPSGLLKFPKEMGENAIKKTIAAWRAAHEVVENQGRTAILHDGADFLPITFNSTDAQFLENRKFQIQEIARAFNIPSPMLGDLERATWSNSEQKGREFLSYTLEPWLRALEGAMGRALFSDDERSRLVIRFDRDDLTRADLSTRATVINSLIASQTINPNEGRGWIGLPPREGGDEFKNPNITTAAPKSGDTSPAPEIADKPKDAADESQ
jgi:HK97 family phage portal protein